MSGERVPNKEDIRNFLQQLRSLDMRLIQKRPNLGDNTVAQLGFVEAMCVAGELDASAYAKGQAAASVIVEIINDMRDGSSSERCLSYLLTEHCVRGRSLEIVGQEIDYSRSQSYRLREKGLMEIQKRLVALEKKHIHDDGCSLQGISLFKGRDSRPKTSDDSCQFFKQIITLIQTKCMACDSCSLAATLA
jgi:hypothetical protein